MWIGIKLCFRLHFAQQQKYHMRRRIVWTLLPLGCVQCMALVDALAEVNVRICNVRIQVKDTLSYYRKLYFKTLRSITAV